MTGLDSTTSPLALVPGDDRALDELARRLHGFAADASAAAGQLREIQGGAWVGEAADAFREQIGDLPRRLDLGADAFFAAQRALERHADVLREARGVAARAVDHWAEGERATARWEAAVREHQRAEQSALMTAALSGLPAASVGPGPSSVDPGADDRALATRLLEGARELVDDSARAAAHVLRDAAEAAPDEPSWLSRAADQVGEFFTGAGEATWGMVEFAWKVSPSYALIDPVGFYEHGRGLVEGLVYGVQNPVEFAKAVVDWETWKENPARALGRLVPDLVLAVATAGAGTAATGARRAAGAVDEAADLARVAERTEGAAGAATRRADDLPESTVRDGFGEPIPLPVEGMPVWRVFGENLDSSGHQTRTGSLPFGPSWTPSDPRLSSDFRVEAGLPDENPGRFVVEGVLRDPDAVNEIRPALPLDGNPGGWAEYLIDDASEAVDLVGVSGVNEPWTRPPGSFAP